LIELGWLRKPNKLQDWGGQRELEGAVVRLVIECAAVPSISMTCSDTLVVKLSCQAVAPELNHLHTLGLPDVSL
jgi:hypothetical protein